MIPFREDQFEWHRMTRMTGPDCAVMWNLINTHTHGNGNDDRIKEGGREVKEREKQQNTCGHHVRNRRDLGGKW